ncbi:MAG TPA: hypothetical protein VKY74_01075 [Chloroflexia bacterium]|nr:hypothetical protein [Chloroflexia bacterium]
MENPTGIWLSELILTHADRLALQAVVAACAQVPWYRQFPPDVLQGTFVSTYQTLAQVFPTLDITPMRVYMDRVIVERIRAGAPAESLMAVASLLESGVHALIDQQPAPGAARAAEAHRLTLAITKNLRLILSGINLRLLTDQSGLAPMNR